MIRRFLTRILMLALLGACGYNNWQVHQMQGEIAHLRRQVAASSSHLVLPRSHTAVIQDAASPTDAKGCLDRARHHAQSARLALARGDFSDAQQEGTHGLDDVQQAAAGPKQQTQAAAKSLRRTLTALQAQTYMLQAQADALWRRGHPTPTDAAPHAAHAAFPAAP